MKLAFKIQYKGTHYSGFQSQKNANSIQDELIRAFKQISVDNLQMNYSGRTDKGVHALGQVFDIVVNQDRSDMQWINGLNSNLPNDISVVDVDRVEDTFHSRFDAIDRTYSYLIFNSPSRNVLLDDFYYWEQSDLDIDKMNEESQCLPNMLSGQQLIEVEQVLINNFPDKVIILRLGGLIGPDRHPIHRLRMCSRIDAGLNPVNLIHQIDVLAGLEKVLLTQKKQHCYNLVSPYHPIKEDYYSQLAYQWKIPPLKFDRQANYPKKISSNRFVSDYDFSFIVEKLLIE